MTQQHNLTLGSRLPHHRLIVYHRALELLAAVREAQIADAKLRDEALRAAKGLCLNIAEASGRVSRADRSRVFAIARGECVECIAALEIAAAAGDALEASAKNAQQIGTEVYLMLAALIR